MDTIEIDQVLEGVLSLMGKRTERSE